jgi:hypothetical protein
MTVKTCRKCSKVGEPSIFAKNKNLCKDCDNARCRDYYHRNPSKSRERRKRRTSRKYNWMNHGLTEQVYTTLLNQENRKCHVCKIDEATQIDHDHACCEGRYGCSSCVRGLVCNRCNTALYFVKDSREQLTKMLDYLKRYESRRLNDNQTVP